MSVVSKIVHIKEVPAGTSIGYYKRAVTDRKSIIGTLHIGYADGVPKNYTNGEVIVHGKRAKIIGSICMDQIMIDITDIPNIKFYDEAVILGQSFDEEISAYEIAKRSNTIPYEILVRFGQRLPKIYI
jgi:alanine racemase